MSGPRRIESSFSDMSISSSGGGGFAGLSVDVESFSNMSKGLNPMIFYTTQKHLMLVVESLYWPDLCIKNLDKF